MPRPPQNNAGSAPNIPDQHRQTTTVMTCRRRRRRRCCHHIEPFQQRSQLSELRRHPPTSSYCFFKSIAWGSFIALIANCDHHPNGRMASSGSAEAWAFSPSLRDGMTYPFLDEHRRLFSSRNNDRDLSIIRRSRFAFHDNQMYRDHNDGEQRRWREEQARSHKDELSPDCERDVPESNSSVALDETNASHETFCERGHRNTSSPVSSNEENSTELSLSLDSVAKEWEVELTRVHDGESYAIANASNNPLSTITNSTATANNDNTDQSNAATATAMATKSVNRHDNLRCLCDSEDYVPLIDEDELDDIFQELMAKVERYNPGAIDMYSIPDTTRPPSTVDNATILQTDETSPPSTPLLQRAYRYAKSAHRGQCRKSGEPYITHPLGVADIIADMKLDLPSLVTALLHDTVEDTPVTLSDISAEFGEEISRLVDGVTKVGRLPFSSSEELQSENYRKLILAMARDIRVVLVKLADRVHNMRTLQYMTPEKQRKIAKETLDIYAPLAHRLGIHWLKTELEDNCFRYLYPEEYQKLVAEVKGREEERKEYEREVVEILRRQMVEAGVGKSGSVEMINGGNGSMDTNTTTLLVTGRTKGLWSIYTKMKRQEIEFDDVHDVVGFRIIVDDVASCYQALGAVHSNWKPVPGKIKDYVALPKPNGYRSLHTTIIGPHKRRIEVQIRTRDMHDVAESGIAAHFLYKEKNVGGAGGNKANDESTRFAWLRELVNEVRRQSDPIEFVNAVKEDLFLKEVLVFSPGGDLYALPRGSSVLDFAFKVHSDLGYHCAGAKVNGKMVSLKHQIKNGDMIEILESIHQTPKREWLQYVRTSKAKNRIRAWLKRRQREHSIVVGKEMINRGLKEYNPRGDDAAARKEYSRKLDHVLTTFRLKDEKHLFTALGYGQISIKNVMTEVFGAAAIATRGHSHSINKKEKDDRFIMQSLENASQSSNNPQFTALSNLNGIIVGQERNIMLKFCKNCSPLEGEKIQGVISKGKGVKIHRLGCKYLLEADEKRIVDVRWDNEAINTSFRPVQLQVLCEDTPGVLANMSRAITTSGFNIGNVHLRKLSNGRGLARLEVMLKSLEDLENVIKRLRQEEGILEVTRR